MCKRVDDEFNTLMNRIIEVRYDDLQEEQRLCRELLQKSEKSGYSFGRMFAHAYLGDYHIAMNQVDSAGEHLSKALRLSEEQDADDCDAIKLKIYCWLALYNSHKGDEQSAIQYYLYADDLARNTGDLFYESLVRNNIAHIYQQHGGFVQALEFYQEAYRLQSGLENPPIRPLVVSNLAEVSILLGKMDDAWAYLQEYLRVEGGSQDQKGLYRNNMCLYSAKCGNKGECQKWAEKILADLETASSDQMLAFGNYTSLFRAMMEIGHQEYAKRFLELMKENCSTGGIEQPQALEKSRMEYCLRFAGQQEQAVAYERYQRKMDEFKIKANETVTKSMNAMVYLDELKRSQEALQNRQESLKRVSDLDELTGLYNRRYFDNRIRRYTKKAREVQLSVILLDVDYFKEYNDFYKHFKGDWVLSEVAACLREHVIEGIFPCRYGGDEFICICEGLERDAVHRYLTSVCDTLRQKALPHEKSHCSSHVTLSVGFAWGAGSNEAESLLETADEALYESKRGGRNTITERQVNANV